MKCPSCGTETNAKFCPNCGASLETADAQAGATITKQKPAKKPIFKKWWFWVIVVIIVLSVIGSLGGDGSTSGDSGTTSSSSSATSSAGTTNSKAEVVIADFSSMSKTDVQAWADTNKVTCKFGEEYSDTVANGEFISQNKQAGDKVKEGNTIQVVYSLGKKPSVEFQNALNKAKIYSETMYMSKKAIYNQLTSEYGERFPADAAQYAIDTIVADWNANALAKAKTYQDMMSMSTSAIYDQLVSAYGEQFTAEEAQYAIDHLAD